MPFDLHIIRAQEFIRMGGRGRVDFKASREALETLGAACRRRGVDRALMDVRQLRSDLTSKELTALVNMFREVGFPQGQRLAVLHVAEQYRRAKAFAFLSALKGWLVRNFTDFEEALEWLSTPDHVESNCASQPSDDEVIPIPISKSNKDRSLFDLSIQQTPRSRAPRKTRAQPVP